MTVEVSKIPLRNKDDLVLDMDDYLVLNLVSTHLDAVVHILLEAGKDSIELSNSEVAALLWPVNEIAGAATKRRG